MLKKILFLLLIFFANLSFADELQTVPSIIKTSQFYFLIDANSKEVLLSKNADTRINPSSMTKLMTAYVVFDQVKQGKISLDNQCLIGKDAWRKSGSSMFLNYGDVVTIDELLKGLLAVSGNDAAIALAGAVGGSQKNFSALMNLKAKELGLMNSHFENPHGLNEENHYMSLRDLATLIIALYRDFPEYASYLKIEEFTYGNITQRNRNPLLKANYDGVLGGKTGHTNLGGYGVVAIVKHDFRTLVAVVNQARTPKQRSQIITELFNYGFNYYKKLILFSKDQEVAEIPVWLGLKDKVSAIVTKEVSFNIPRNYGLEDVKVKVKFVQPLQAPIASGSKIADLIIEIKDHKNLEYSLFAKEKIGKVGILEKISVIASYKFKNFINKHFK